MATTTHPTSIRLSRAEKRRIAAFARKRGLSPAAYIKRAALADPVKSGDAKFARLERIAGALLETVEDERDYRLAAARWANHVKNNTRLLTREEFLRGMDI